MSERKLRALVENRVPGLFYIMFLFGMMELGILLICVVSAANQTRVTVYNPEHTIVYEDIYSAGALDEFKRVYGIKDFKAEGFVVTRQMVDRPFPTRTWIALSICIPLALILFIAFVVRVYEDLFHTKKRGRKPDVDTQADSGSETGLNDRQLETAFEETRLEKLFSTLGRLNIYSLGAAVLGIFFLYWMVPDLLVHIGKIGFQTMTQFKWVLLCLILVGGAYLILQAILSHRTRQQIIRRQSEIQIHRDRLLLKARQETRLLPDRQDTPPDDR